jgi:hypothetical protein
LCETRKLPGKWEFCYDIALPGSLTHKADFSEKSSVQRLARALNFWAF